VKVVLATDVGSLGRKGDVVSVADGYARNFLVPQGLAIVATKGSLRQAEDMRRAREEKERKAREAATRRAATLASQPVYISARAGESGRLFGSVTKSDVARAVLEQLGEEVDRQDVHLEDPIRAVGSHTIGVQVHKDVEAAVAVEVIPYEDEVS
jgi:large subunit ribosomal protein L9